MGPFKFFRDDITLGLLAGVKVLAQFADCNGWVVHVRYLQKFHWSPQPFFKYAFENLWNFYREVSLTQPFDITYYAV